MKHLNFNSLILAFALSVVTLACGRSGSQLQMDSRAQQQSDENTPPDLDFQYPDFDQNDYDSGKDIDPLPPSSQPGPTPAPVTEPSTTPSPSPSATPGQTNPSVPTQPSEEPTFSPTPEPGVSPSKPVNPPRDFSFPPENERGTKPGAVYTRILTEKYKEKLNAGRDLAELSEADRVKYYKIFAELKRVGNVRQPPPSSLLFIDEKVALALSKKFESDGTISKVGAWTIAVEGTAKRHGFANVPCAEFQSELIRQAYARAGYNVEDDFNEKKGNALIYTQTASVTGLGWSLLKAGWSVWDASKFRAPIGAILFHTNGTSPGHIYMSGGADGSLIIDNASPRGRDLRKATQKVVDYMYKTGGFYLPPGFKPTPW